MVWTINIKESAAKEIRKLAKNEQTKILNYLKEKVLKANNPRDFGKALMHDKVGLWRYRVEKFRIICEIQDNELTILVLKIGKRDKVYD